MFHGHYSKVALLYFLLVLSFLSCERICSVLCDSVVSASKSDYEGEAAYEESIRKEMIKVQILQKLGLNEKPNVDKTHKLSKDLALEILKRTEENNNDHESSTASSNHQNATANSEDEGNFAKTSEIISFPDKGPILNGHTLVSFSYAGNNAYGVGVRVKKAHLWVKMDYRSSIGRHFGHLLHPKGVTLYVFNVNGNYSHKRNVQNQTHLTSQDVQMDLVISRTIMMDSLGWQKLDITPVVQKWYNKNSRHRIRHGGNNNHHHHHHGKNHREKLTLLVDCAGCGYSIHPVTFSQPNNPTTMITSQSDSSLEKVQSSSNKNDLNSSSSAHHHHHYNQDSSAEGVTSSQESAGESNNDIPFLVLETESSPNSKRSRRRALECSPKVKHCCKQRFYVSFHDLGWDDWIIAPKGYYANYCRGHCGGPFRTPDTFLNYHTHVMEEYRRTTDGQSNLEGITPCCAPTKFAPMSLIYFGPDFNIIKRDLPKMIVEECGCP